MIHRHLQSKILELALQRHKMAFVSGPRQCGKTTLSRDLLLQPNLYFNWDQMKFRQMWSQDPDHVANLALAEKKPRVVFDEIHKNRKWKTQLKGFYDQYGPLIQIMVTGSARMDTDRRGGDSLLGRFLHFHLHPLSWGELLKKAPQPFEEFQAWVASTDLPVPLKDQEAQEAFFRFGGFPEPLLEARQDVHQIWQAHRLELLIRQDLRDLSKVNELSQVEVLASLLPLKVGSPLSAQSLRKDLEVSPTTVQRWLGLLGALYYHFEIRPYAKSVVRSLKKEPKIYLYDWSSIEQSGPRFENMVASQLLKIFDQWTDTGQAQVELCYLRNKEKQEVDFLAVKNKKPWFTVEAKIADLNLDRTYQVFQRQLKVPHFQIVRPSGVGRLFKTDSGTARVISFADFFASL